MTTYPFSRSGARSSARAVAGVVPDGEELVVGGEVLDVLPHQGIGQDVPELRGMVVGWSSHRVTARLSVCQGKARAGPATVMRVTRSGQRLPHS